MSLNCLNLYNLKLFQSALVWRLYFIMNNVEYPNFIIRTVNSNITIDNFYKQDYTAYSIDNKYMFTIYRTFVSMPIAEGLCSGNTKECIAAINTYLNNMKYHIDGINKAISQIPTLGNLNNCDELRNFMMSHFDDPLIGTSCFQGDMVEFDGYAVPKEGEIIPIDSVNFTVGTVNEVTNTFVLTLGKFSDEAYGVELPAYVREELIATLRGE